MRRIGSVVLVLGVFLGGIVACTSAGAPPLLSPADAARLTARGQPTTVEELQQGRTLFVGRCASCHLLPRPEGYRADQWPTFVREMTARAKLNASEADRLLRYLIAASEAPPARPAP
jgi:hypothetical protein